MSTSQEKSTRAFFDVKSVYEFGYFTPQEKKLAHFFNTKSVVWLAAWCNGNQDPIDEMDGLIWGLSHNVMKCLATRVARHKTGAMPIPELEKPPLPRPDPAQAAQREVLQDLCTSLAGQLEYIEKNLKGAFRQLEGIKSVLK